ncbi:MAG: 50S ribosomal protein L13 [Candidatus Aenigmarchaeota archaeon]|nr:50S ribosomal protein L13 [Candidatus Aenigmarchaeota archaeon]
MIIDAKNALAGRLASSVAKKLLKGDKIVIINCEQAIISGEPEATRKKYAAIRARGSPQHGPYFPKRPDLILRRIIRGMLPYKTGSGRSSMKRLRIFIGFPEYAEGKHIMVPEEALREVKTKYITIGNLAKALGWRN